MIEDRLNALSSAVAKLRREVGELKRLMAQAAANADLLYQTCRGRGEIIEGLRQKLERLQRHHDGEK